MNGLLFLNSELFQKGTKNVPRQHTKLSQNLYCVMDIFLVLALVYHCLVVFVRGFLPDDPFFLPPPPFFPPFGGVGPGHGGKSKLRIRSFTIIHTSMSR